jgi:hypothetical protein
MNKSLKTYFPTWIGCLEKENVPVIGHDVIRLDPIRSIRTLCGVPVNKLLAGISKPTLETLAKGRR